MSVVRCISLKRTISFLAISFANLKPLFFSTMLRTLKDRVLYLTSILFYSIAIRVFQSIFIQLLTCFCWSLYS